MTSRVVTSPRIGIIGVAMAGALAACGGPSSDAAREAEIENYARQFGVDADVELDETGEVRTVRVGSVGGGQVGMNLDAPDGFPDDIALYPGLSISASTALPQNGFMLQGQTDASVDEIAAFYAERMTADGWNATADTSPTPTMRNLRFEKADRMANVNLIDGGGTVTAQIQTMTPP